MVDQFDLERFEWNAPDRLEVSGQFHGLEGPAAEPVLIVHGGGSSHRLHAEPDSAAHDNGQWHAEFVWDGVPVGVESAILELGPDIAIDLPPPGAGSTPSLDVRHAEGAAGTDVALQAQRLAAEQETQELRAALERTEAELARARSDLESERTGRAADAQRFREGLAQVQASAEQALAAEREKAERDAETLREQAVAADGLRQRLGAEAGETRAAAERLLERLNGLVDTLDAGK
jgi:hypothetical protein